jgi:hypothetical protein
VASRVTGTGKKGHTMRFPVDIAKVQLICGGAAEPSLVYDTREQRTNQKGEPLFQVQLMAGGDDRPLVIPVRTPVEPKGLSFGVPVRAVGLALVPWTSRTGGGGGVNYEADRIEPVRPVAS